VNVWPVPLVRPDTTHDVAGATAVHDPAGDPVTTYPVTALPPSLTGAAHDTVTCPLSGTPETPVGAPGTVRGATDPLTELAAPAPATFDATTVNVCPVPLVRPDTTHDVAGATAVHDPPGVPVTAYPVTGEPPVLAGAVHDTVT
jgi:hypothetical protein